ncbi:lysine transporter LysE [Xaviernesmea oryzae]|uniref:Lysine transporter LysE n=1 Tax=Xaviernesmea oryzae TaxID=464029 RepID=A0A1Q9B2I8_9HYPH|nr:LysE family translocator [Xaviernesmea oryzae]OLP62229.1 lysine transporter LysE [Xaviernesmea oryzae]SEL92566.1 Threonine/homoserine/homoserine lactone efflux protein [Xaviernesmea oryzae]
MTLQFFLTALVIVLLPGPGVVYTLALGLQGGLRAGLTAAFGCMLGILPHMAAGSLGLAALLAASALLFHAVQIAGVIYLLVMAWRTWHDKEALSVQSAETGLGPVRIVLTAIGLNLFNPKLSLFFLAFLPQFVDSAEARPLLHLLLLGGAFMGLTFIVFAAYGTFAATARDLLTRRPGFLIWLRRSFAVAFALMGVRLAFATR